MFALFLNDLESFLLGNENNGIEIRHRTEESFFLIKLLILLYADDTVIIAEDADSFQKCLNDFQVYCSEWKLNVNISKTKVIVFGTNNNSKYSFKLGNEILDTVNEYKYLGVFFSRSGFSLIIFYCSLYNIAINNIQ